jgi:hypothetical protein
MSGVFREEVLNVVLAEMLKRRGSLSTPERIKRVHTSSGNVRRMPDVIIAAYQGVRVVLEGRSGEGADTERTLTEDAKRRVEEGLAPICIAVHYPSEVRRASSMEELEAVLARVTLRVRVFNELGEGEWTESSLENLSAIIRRSYDDLVREDIIAQTVADLEGGIETMTSALLDAKANPDRLRRVLGIRETAKDSEDVE